MILHRTLLATALLAATGLAPAAEATTIPTGPLPRNVVPSEVGLHLTIDPTQERFSGRVEISVDVARPTDTIWMHGKGLHITRAVYMPRNGRNQELTAAEVDVSGVLKLTAPKTIAPGQGVIAIDYDAPFGQLQGAYKVKPDGNDYVMTQMEPLGARTAFPGFDEPSFKQPWRMTFTVPDADVVVANAPEVKTTDLKGPMKEVQFAKTEALPSYLVAFAVGPWDVVPGPDSVVGHGTTHATEAEHRTTHGAHASPRLTSTPRTRRAPPADLPCCSIESFPRPRRRPRPRPVSTGDPAAAAIVAHAPAPAPTPTRHRPPSRLPRPPPGNQNQAIRGRQENRAQRKASPAASIPGRQLRPAVSRGVSDA